MSEITPPNGQQAAMDAAVVTALRLAIARLVATSDADDAPLREPLRAFAAEARRVGLRAEQTLVVLHRICDEIPEMVALQRQPTLRRALMGRLASLCIDAYYEGGP